jgi:hypothetical protein
MPKPVGWRGESNRHRLAKFGIETSGKISTKTPIPKDYLRDYYHIVHEKYPEDDPFDTLTSLEEAKREKEQYKNSIIKHERSFPKVLYHFEPEAIDFDDDPTGEVSILAATEEEAGAVFRKEVDDYKNDIEVINISSNRNSGIWNFQYRFIK